MDGKSLRGTFAYTGGTGVHLLAGITRWVRDVTYTEDHSRIRTTNTPRIMATLRNLAISSLRHHRWDTIAKDLRHISRNPTQPLTPLGIPA